MCASPAPGLDGAVIRAHSGRDPRCGIPPPIWSEGAVPVQKRSLTLSGHRTSLALEPEFWAALEAVAVRRGVSLPALIGEIDTTRPRARGLASAARVFALLNLDHSPPVLED